MTSQKFYSNKVLSQKNRRCARRKQFECLSTVGSSNSEGSDADAIESMLPVTVANTTDTLMSHQAYAPSIPTNGYEFDDEDRIDNDDSPSLFTGASVNVRSATMVIMKFAMSVNLDKSHTVKLLKLVKSLLPHPNTLPTSHRSVLKLFGRTSAFTSKYVCEKCENDIGEDSGSVKRCSNSDCPYFNQNLVNNRFTEIITMDVRSAIHSVVKQNFNLFSTDTNLFPVGDIVHSDFYLNHNKVSEKSLLSICFAHSIN